jgi:hypothetical protein
MQSSLTTMRTILPKWTQAWWSPWLSWLFLAFFSLCLCCPATPSWLQWKPSYLSGLSPGGPPWHSFWPLHSQTSLTAWLLWEPSYLSWLSLSWLSLSFPCEFTLWAFICSVQITDSACLILYIDLHSAKFMIIFSLFLLFPEYSDYFIFDPGLCIPGISTPRHRNNN